MKEYTLCECERLNNSVNGNPRYILSLLDEEGNYIIAKTQSDCSFNYRLRLVHGEKIAARIEYTRAGNAIIRDARNIIKKEG